MCVCVCVCVTLTGGKKRSDLITSSLADGRKKVGEELLDEEFDWTIIEMGMFGNKFNKCVFEKIKGVLIEFN